MKKLFLGQFLANFARDIEFGNRGRKAQKVYLWLRGKKRYIGLGVYLICFTAAATATKLGGCVATAAAATAACAWVIRASRFGMWLSWVFGQLGILDYDARVWPKGGYADILGSAGQQGMVLLIVLGTGLIARALGVPAELMDTFERDILLTVLGHIGILSVSTATRTSVPSFRTERG